MNRAKMVFLLLVSGKIGLLGREFKRRLYSNERSLCLRRDLDIPFETPAAKLAIEIRPLHETDVGELLDVHDEGIPGKAVKDRVQRKLFLPEKVPVCYVAVTEDGSPAFMQWLMAATENEKIQEYFCGGVPVLNEDEGLLEFGFTLEKYRGLRIMPHAISEIAKKGRDFGAKYIITFVPEKNIPSLKGCKRAGFSPYMVRVARWRWFRRRCQFKMLPPGTPFSFDSYPAAEPVPSSTNEKFS
ncbi:hypothetical protein A7E78_12745 [Syntrophotalea acetylenivorans]|uniref:N-acetyltransferase domain-containing protein n=2 Tax=Syntrophotalea acetylenivorans TaxID=1842532 RepID=A0A1L3GRR3_9BACT|nr:hypothetical protein A7E78_12745 [Syntrophotalea acetylenivorans]